MLVANTAIKSVFNVYTQKRLSWKIGNLFFMYDVRCALYDVSCGCMLAEEFYNCLLRITD